MRRCAGVPILALLLSGCVLDVSPEADPGAAKPGRLEARELTLVDARGQPWAVLGAAGHGERAQGLYVSRPGSDASVCLGVDPQGNTFLGLSDASGQVGLALVVGQDEGRPRSGVSLHDAEGHQRLWVSLDEQGRALIQFAGAQEQPRLVVHENGLAFFDAEQRPRLVLGLEGDGAPRVTALDAAGEKTELVPR